MSGSENHGHARAEYRARVMHDRAGVVQIGHVGFLPVSEGIVANDIVVIQGIANETCEFELAHADTELCVEQVVV